MVHSPNKCPTNDSLIILLFIFYSTVLNISEHFAVISFILLCESFQLN